MSRLLLVLILILVVLVGGTFFLAGRSTDKPTTHVEKQVNLANLS